jgi:hypothetical protein
LQLADDHRDPTRGTAGRYREVRNIGIATAAASHRQKYSVASAVEHRQNCMCCDQRALIPISRELF